MAKKKKAKAKPKIKEIKKEESELEKDIEETEEIVEENKLQKFLQAKSFSPVLEKIQETPEPLDLEQVAGSAPLPEKPKEKEEFKYSGRAEQKEEQKYQDIESIKYEQPLGALPSRVDITSMGKGDLIQKPEIHLTASPESRLAESPKYEKYEAVKRFEMEKAGKQNLLEKKEIKYTPSKQ